MKCIEYSMTFMNKNAVNHEISDYYNLEMYEI